MDLRTFSRDLDRLTGARHWDFRNFCTDLNELGGAGGDLTKLARDLSKLDRDTRKIQERKKAHTKFQKTITSPSLVWKPNGLQISSLHSSSSLLTECHEKPFQLIADPETDTIPSRTV